MFYSQQTHAIRKNASHLHTRQVFTGQYWDEFGLTGHLVPDSAKVLMLGLALGGGVRPVLAANKKIELTAVDLDSRSLQECRQTFAEHFPSISFSTACADAGLFLAQTPERYHAIWLDLYLAESYAPLVFDSKFLTLIRERLAPGGVLLVNAYGLPNQFSPLRSDSLQAALGECLQSTFSFLGAIPYRRNVTFLASEQRPILYACDPHPALSAVDRQTFRLQRAFLRNLGECPSLHGTLSSERLFMQEIDREMRASWRYVLEGLACRGEKIENGEGLLNLLQDEERGRRLLNGCLSSYEDWLGFFPILAAGEANLRRLDVHWLFHWFLENAEALKKATPEAYLQIWLKQLWALAVNPDVRYRQHLLSLQSVFPKENP